MSNIRRVKIGDKKYKLLPLKHDHKHLLGRYLMDVSEWLFLSENDDYLWVVHKGTLEKNPIVKRLAKHRRVNL